MGSTPELTRLLLSARAGGQEERDALFGAVYDELRRLASRQRQRHAANSTLHTTALVHESYLKLVDQAQLGDGDRLRFFAIAATAMRHILVDHYRRRSAAKRGGEYDRVDIDPDELAGDARVDMLLDLHDSLGRLVEIEPRQARVVELRFFAGLNDAEIGELLGVSDRTVRNDWTRAKAWLAQDMSGGGGDA